MKSITLITYNKGAGKFFDEFSQKKKKQFF